MNDKQKLQAIKKYLIETRKSLDKAMKNDREYNTSTGNGVNCCEASHMFREVESQIGDILNE